MHMHIYVYTSYLWNLSFFHKNSLSSGHLHLLSRLWPQPPAGPLPRLLLHSKSILCMLSRMLILLSHLLDNNLSVASHFSIG